MRACKGSDDMSTDRPLQQKYIEEVLERAISAWPKEGIVEERWTYDRCLASGKKEDLKRFKVARNEARKSIREAKNSWFRAKAQEAEGEHFGGEKVWKCIRDMQFGRRDRVPPQWLPSVAALVSAWSYSSHCHSPSTHQRCCSTSIILVILKPLLHTIYSSEMLQH